MNTTTRTAIAILLLTAACRYEEPFVSENNLQIDPSTTVAAADGEAQITLTLTVTGIENKRGRAIVLTATLGTFGNGEKSQTLQTTSDGKATAVLKSLTPGTATVQFNLADVLYVYRDYTFTKTELDEDEDKLDVILTGNGADADGESTIQIAGVLSGQKEYGGRDITLFTTIGTFENNQNSITLKTDPAGRAETKVKSSTPSTGTLNVNAGDIIYHSYELSFTPAEPDQISLNVPVFEATSGAGSPIKITATLKRNVGKPTEGFIPTFKALYLGNEIGEFNTPVPNGNTVAVDFVIPDPNFEGEIQIKAMLDVDGNPIQGEYGPIYYKKRN